MDAAVVAVLVEGVAIVALFCLVGYVIHKLGDSASHRIARVLISLAALLGAVPALLWAIAALPHG